MKEYANIPSYYGDPEWLINDRFGLFIHWGTYALAARHEWVKFNEKIDDETYQKYFEHFDPDLFEPKEWARSAKNAGMKYVVVTTKHHEGFALWDSELTEYKAPNTWAEKDLLKEIVQAFRDEGLKIGFYHSVIDWNHPEFPIDGLHPQGQNERFRKEEEGRDIKQYRKYLHGQVEELLSNYGKIDYLWFDFSYPHLSWDFAKGKDSSDWESEKLEKRILELQPDIILNDRLDLNRGVYTPEQIQPLTPLEKDGKPVVWEACQTLNGSWGYDRDNLDWKPVDMLIKMLVDTVSKSGNLLLNVGPDARGVFEPRSTKSLNGIGDWMKLHSRSIYGAKHSDYTPPKDCRYTQKGDRLYIHIFSWPIKHLTLPDLGNKIKYAQLLNDASEVHILDLTKHRVDVDSNSAVIELPIQKPDVDVPVIEIFLK